jgi:hypothetical protein
MTFDTAHSFLLPVVTSTEYQKHITEGEKYKNENTDNRFTTKDQMQIETDFRN